MWIVRGAPGAGKTAHVFREFRKAIKSGTGVARIVVPTATLVRHYQHELARDGVVFSPKWISSLSRFAVECAPEVRVLPEGLRRAIVRDVLKRGTAPEFNEVASTEGMTSTILDTIDLFENAGAAAGALKGKRLAPLGSAFLKVWNAVEAGVRSRGYSSRHDLFRAAAERIGSLGFQQIWMDGFLTFSRLETELLQAMDRACDLTLVLPNGPEADEAYKMALTMGGKNRQIEGGRPKPRLECFTPPSMEREADEICGRILDLQSRGFEFQDIGVALRDNATYLPAIRAAFERFGIPARYYFAGVFAEHPAAEFLSGLVECVLGGWKFEQALATFKLHPRWGTSQSFDGFDFALRDAMPGRGEENLRAAIESYFQDEAHWLRSRLLQTLQIDLWRGEMLAPARWAKRLDSLAEILEDRRVDLPHDFTSLETMRSYGAALHVWSVAVAEAVDFWPVDTPPISLEEFWRVASDCMAGASLRVADDRRNVVHVMSAFEARQWDVRALFICGMSDRDYPRRHPENLLFPDSECRKLSMSLHLGVRTARDMDDEESRLFPALRFRAREILILSVPAKDASGRSVIRSSFLLDYSSEESGWSMVKPEPRFVREHAGIQGRLQNDTLLEQLTGIHKTVSPTGLESLAQCSFQFFSKQALRLKLAPVKPEDRFNFLVQGNILHDTLKRWAEGGSILAVFEESFDEACRKSRIPESYQLEVKRLDLRRVVQSLDLSRAWNADRSLVEQDLRLRLRNGIEMKGRADRIDILGGILNNDCVVVDYKSGNAANVEGMVSSETRLQGPLYALAAKENLGLNPIAMVYWALKNGKMYGWGEIPGAGLELSAMPERWMESARERIVEKLERYLAGEIPARPADRDQCKWCDYQHGCRVEEQHLVAIGGANA